MMELMGLFSSHCFLCLKFCGSAIAASSDYIRGKFKILLDGFQKMFDLLFSNSKDLIALEAKQEVECC